MKHWIRRYFNGSYEEYCFDIACFDGGANLLINSIEQMFTEKLRSLLKFGQNSTRFKDIFDLCYLSERLDKEKLGSCFDTYIFSDTGMRENSIEDICRRVQNTFSPKKYLSRLSTSRKNWLGIPEKEALDKIEQYLISLKEQP